MPVMIVYQVVEMGLSLDPRYRNTPRQVIVNQGEPPPLDSAS